MKVKRDGIFERRVTAPAVVTLLLYGSYGATLTLEPFLSARVGLLNTGIFFTFFTAGSAGIRALAGRIPDIYGRVPVLKVASLLMCGAMVMMAIPAVSWWLLSAGLLYGLSMGLMSPATSAWTVDLALPEHRGRALSTMYIALEAGIGFGALFSGWWYERSAGDTTTVFFIMGTLALISFLYLQLIAGNKR
jgi:MFS family permease